MWIECIKEFNLFIVIESDLIKYNEMGPIMVGGHCPLDSSEGQWILMILITTGYMVQYPYIYKEMFGSDFFYLDMGM